MERTCMFEGRCLKHKNLLNGKKIKRISQDLKTIICNEYGCRKKFKTKQGLDFHKRYSFYHNAFNK